MSIGVCTESIWLKLALCSSLSNSLGAFYVVFLDGPWDQHSSCILLKMPTEVFTGRTAKPSVPWARSCSFISYSFKFKTMTWEGKKDYKNGPVALGDRMFAPKERRNHHPDIVLLVCLQSECLWYWADSKFHLLLTILQKSLKEPFSQINIFLPSVNKSLLYCRVCWRVMRLNCFKQQELCLGTSQWWYGNSIPSREWQQDLSMYHSFLQH